MRKRAVITHLNCAMVELMMLPGSLHGCVVVDFVLTRLWFWLRRRRSGRRSVKFATGQGHFLCTSHHATSHHATVHAYHACHVREFRHFALKYIINKQQTTVDSRFTDLESGLWEAFTPGT
jgi:hypothetical protein